MEITMYWVTCESIEHFPTSFLPSNALTKLCVAVLLPIESGIRGKELGGQTSRRSSLMEQTPQPKLVPGKRWGKSKRLGIQLPYGFYQVSEPLKGSIEFQNFFNRFLSIRKLKPLKQINESFYPERAKRISEQESSTLKHWKVSAGESYNDESEDAGSAISRA